MEATTRTRTGGGGGGGGGGGYPRRDNRQLIGMLVAAVVVIVVAVGLTLHAQQVAADRTFEEHIDAERILTSMLDQETGLRGFAINHREEFLEPYIGGRRDLEDALGDARRAAREDDVGGLLDRQERAARAWQERAEVTIAYLRAHPTSLPQPADGRERKALFDRFRARNAALRDALDGVRGRQQRAATRTTVGLILGISVLFGLVGWVVLSRAGRREREELERASRYETTQREFEELLQVARAEDEAQELLVGHIERSIPASRVAVFNRSASQNRLDLASGDVAVEVADRLAAAEPRDCLAIRLSRRVDADPDGLVACGICGGVPGDTSCTPLRVGGEVIGSVLVQREAGLDDADQHRIGDSVTLSAPTLGNLRTLAIAERRALTDVLTGLPNRRAMHDTMLRLIAQANRSERPLSIAMLDIDHFKSINDELGHEAGDSALASAAQCLEASARAGDLVARIGGEEFLLGMPDTDAEGAAVMGERVRAAIERLEVPAVPRALTISIGVAQLEPGMADLEELMRRADRALYAAKQGGRNRVVLAD